MQTIVISFRYRGSHPLDGHKENTPIIIIGPKSHLHYEIAHILQKFYKYRSWEAEGFRSFRTLVGTRCTASAQTGIGSRRKRTRCIASLIMFDDRIGEWQKTLGDVLLGQGVDDAEGWGPCACPSWHPDSFQWEHSLTPFGRQTSSGHASRKRGKLIVSETLSNTTVTGKSTARSSGAASTILLMRRGPSSNSIIATL